MAQDFFIYAVTVLATSGTATLIILGLSGYVGKIWATRIMEKERLKHALELEKLSNDLKSKNNEHLASFTHELEILKNAHLKQHDDKLVIYRTVIEMVATMLAKLELIVLNKRAPLNSSELEEFEAERLRMYGYLGMLAPQEIMDANDQLTDLLLSVVHENKQTDWLTVRGRAIHLINTMRRDIGIDKTPIHYNGER